MDIYHCRSFYPIQVGLKLRSNCLIKHFTEERIGGIEVTERQGGRYEQLLDDIKKTREYWKLKEKALDRILWGSRFEKGYEPVVRQTTEE